MEPRLSQFGPSLGWLLSKDVSASRLGDLFGTTSENIRVIAFRARHAVPIAVPNEASFSESARSGIPPRVGVRLVTDEVVRTPAKNRALDAIKSEIDLVVDQHTKDYDYLRGIRELRRLLPKIGFAGDSRRIALAALLRQHIAWLMVHAGLCESAAYEARTARELWKIAYRESPQREYAARFIQSALIGSHAMLLIRRPEPAWKILDIADDASRAIGAPIGSDHFRQRGVALFQLQKDEQAIKHFRESQQVMEKLKEARVPAQLLMTGLRHTSFLELDFDKSSDVLAAARREFGSQSLEVVMATHWTAACGLMIDSDSVNEDSATLLRDAAEPPTQFGHQLTIRKLLSLTPHLGFDARLRRLWVRRTLYENAFRNR